VRIKDKLLGDQNGYIGPAAGTSLTAKDVKVFVEGINGTTGALAATPNAKIGLANEVRAHIYVPNGTLLIKQSSVVHGVFIGKWVQIGLSVSATVEDPLDEVGDDAGVQQDPQSAGDLNTHRLGHRTRVFVVEHGERLRVLGRHGDDLGLAVPERIPQRRDDQRISLHWLRPLGKRLAKLLNHGLRNGDVAVELI
jgi:hypothetical protein